MSAPINTPDFAEIVRLIDAARQQAYRAANTTLIELCWQVGAYLSAKIEAAEWGDGVIGQLAQHLAVTQPNLQGFTRSNLFRMRQFYETYQQDEKVVPLVRQLSWSHNLIILGQSKRPQEREFYLKMAIKERWSKRELERQFNTALFERVVLNPVKVSPVLTQLHSGALNVFKDSYPSFPQYISSFPQYISSFLQYISSFLQYISSFLQYISSLPRRRESMGLLERAYWIPACVGTTRTVAEMKRTFQ